ncbi:MAG: hypothetical protein NC223_06790 [Butyrivibrio sp.]|nr:hypothetical protein [Butyrivibrio sp.]
MFTIIILILLIVDTVLLIRLNRCGRIVNVREKHEHIYIPQPKKVVRKVEVEED